VPVEVTVPEGVWAGDQFTVDSPFGGSYDIICPDGCGPGMAIVVDLPAAGQPALPPAAESTTQPVEVVVPDGVYCGEYFTVDFDGAAYDIQCPDGCGPGSAIIVDLPAGPPEQQPPAEPPPSEKENALPPGFETIGKKGKGLALSLNLGGGLKLSLAVATVRRENYSPLCIQTRLTSLRHDVNTKVVRPTQCKLRASPFSPRARSISRRLLPRSKASSRSASRSRCCDPTTRGASLPSRSTTGGPATTRSCCPTCGSNTWSKRRT
jgi:hypothetical protein